MVINYLTLSYLPTAHLLIHRAEYLAKAPSSLKTKIASAKQIPLLSGGGRSGGSRSNDIIYNTRTEGDGGGEKSEKEMIARFDKKLEDR